MSQTTRLAETEMMLEPQGGLVDKLLRPFTKIRDAITKTDYFAMAETCMARIRRPIDQFKQTLTEANYNSQPRSLWSLISGKKRDLPETTSLIVGNGMISTSKRVGNRFLWAALFAALSTHTLIVAAVGLAAAGLTVFGLEYYRAKKDREDTITEVNFAGQKVEGTRADLCHLHHAQLKIMNIGTAFKQASLESTTDTIGNILESVAEERKRIKIIDAGPYGAMSSTYDFSRPEISLINKDERQIAMTMAVAEPPSAFPKAGEAPSLSDGWRRRHDKEEIILDQLLALQKSLPPRLKKRFEHELRKVG